jgi:hypothetical protein
MFHSSLSNAFIWGRKKKGNRVGTDGTGFDFVLFFNHQKGSVQVQSPLTDTEYVVCLVVRSLLVT